MTCEKHTGLAERLAVVETEVRNNKKFIQDIHDDHENSKKELSKIKITIATWSTVGALLGSGLFKILSDIKLTWLQQSINYCKAVWFMVFPDSYAGN
jgi:hypothetical protein